MSVAKRLSECLQELQSADYGTDEAARRSDAAASRLLALVWEAALTHAALSDTEQRSLAAALRPAAGPLRARAERLACTCTFRTELHDSLLRERSALQFLLDGCLGAPAAAELTRLGLADSAALLDHLIRRFRADPADPADSDDDLRPKQPHAGVPSSHTWWSR